VTTLIIIAVFYLWYLTAMWFLRRRHQLREKLGPIYWWIVGIVLGGIVLDVAFNWSFAILIFMDWPKEVMFTKRLQRYREGWLYKATWRMRLADTICENMLNKYDPTGKHC